MSDGKKSRSSSYCTPPIFANRRTLTNETRSSFLCWAELWRYFRCSSSTRRPTENPCAAIALEHPRRHYPIYRKWTEPNTPVLEGYAAQHTADGIWLGHILFYLELAAA